MDTQTPEKTATLTVTDLQVLANIIEACTQRGAFKAEELFTVGAVFNKLNAFIEQQAPKATDAAEDSKEA